jgi:hypothetical protein
MASDVHHTGGLVDLGAGLEAVAMIKISEEKPTSVIQSVA